MNTLSNPSNILWDIESNGLLKDVTEIHCLSVLDLDTGQAELFTNKDPSKRSLYDGLSIVYNAESEAGHNLIGYDKEVLLKLVDYHEGFTSFNGTTADTLILSRLLYPEIRDTYNHPSNFPKKLLGSHSLKAWGLRLGEEKDDYQGGWENYSDDMGKYCLQDTRTNYRLYLHLKQRAEDLDIPWDFKDLTECICLEHEFAKVIAKQVRTGFYFDSTAAHKLVAPLQKEKEDIQQELSDSFGLMITGKKELKTRCNFTLDYINPRSRLQVGQALMAKGWTPTTFTKTGQPKIDEKTMAKCSVPESDIISRILTVEKRLGQIANGANAWLKLERGGKIHGEVNTLGAVTGRVSHTKPNMSQVPASYSYLGKECRALFSCKPGWSLVGADLSGIELRCLAHYLWHWDKGEYASIILEGDIHTANQEAAQLPTRDNAKTFIYGYIYGAGDEKLGFIVAPLDSKSNQTKIGAQLRKKFEKKYPALKQLRDAVKKKLKKTGGYIRGLDGRPLYCRSNHSSLNTLLQSAGAVIAKLGYVLFNQELEEFNDVYELHGFFHDEYQVGCPSDTSEHIGNRMVRNMTLAGTMLGVRIRIDGEYKVGKTWADTH